MVTDKLTAIWRIIRTRNFTLLTSHKAGVKYLNSVDDELAIVMTMVVAMDRNHKNMLTYVRNQAVEAGDLHTLEALRTAIEELNKYGN